MSAIVTLLDERLDPWVWPFLSGGDTIKQNSKAGDIVLGLFLYGFVLWAALLFAQCWGGSLADLLPRMAEALQHPTEIQWTERSALSILLCSGAYLFGVALYFTTRGRTRDGEEHGSAMWGSPGELNRQFAQRKSKPLTRHVRLGTGQ